MNEDLALRKPATPALKKEEKLTVVEQRICEHKFISEHINMPVSIFLTSGVRLQCNIVGFDDVCLVTTHKDSIKKRQLVFKHAISSICED